jgi:hypothetical protein
MHGLSMCIPHYIVFLIQHADMLQDHNNRVLMRATDQC